MFSTMPMLPLGAMPKELIIKCAGYYECPKSEAGKRLGPLVGYAGKDESGRQFVGDVYVNFAKVERWPMMVLSQVITPLCSQMRTFDRFHACCGAPEGGKTLAALLAVYTGSCYFYPEKKITALKTDTSREVSELVFDRHEVPKDSRVVIVEDVCNNFSTTALLIERIEEAGATVVAIACFLNRSLTVTGSFNANGRSYPVAALWREPIMEYRQDDPAVAEDVASGNVVWKPKHEWERLQHFMDCV